ncbi:hypothetical protein O3G_MSEX008093 [Manduca sexta]|uniref:Uncharacterized protein n=1 Tax=Manduca sexta TaxID=7130 RepID=A0A921Z8E3_MANSE|nr:hypothetical protein O3G_MSEX008093 [Manduca sexta]
MADSVNMSLDEIIKKNQQDRVSRSRGRGGGNRGRGGGRGGGRGRGRGGNNRGRSNNRPATPGGRQERSRSRGPRAPSQSRSRSQSRNRSRSRSRQQRRSNSRARSRSRSQLRGLTPKGRAGLELQQSEVPQLVRSGRSFRGGAQNRGNVHSRLGVTTRRGAANLRRPLAVAKRGISKRGRGISTNRYSNIGLRSDQILKEQRQNMMMHNNMIKSQTFTRSRNNSFSSASQLTVSVANDFARKRRNSVGNAGYLNKQSLAQLNNQFSGYNTRRGPSSVNSMGSNKSNRSNRSMQSNGGRSRGSTRSRGRGRGANRGVSRNFINKQVLNIKLQKEIAAIQGKTYSNNVPNDTPTGVNFTPTPAATGQTLHQRFAST